MKKSVLLIAILSMIGTVVFGVLSYLEYRPILICEKKNEVLKEAVQEEMYQISTLDEEQACDDGKTDIIKEFVKDKNDFYNRRIDFEILNTINQDIAGWIYIPDTSVDYPILIGDTNDMYLYKDFEGQESVLGSIFSYADTKHTLTDARTILFGHNIKFNQMFGELKKYRNQDFRMNHKEMYVYTKTKTMELQIFSVFICDETDAILWDNVELGSLEYQELLTELERRNLYSDIGIEKLTEKYNHQTFSLVTCNGSSGSSKRFIISGIVVREKYILR